MTGYTRFWNCERCGEHQESIDRPTVEVCDGCIGADIVITRQMHSSRAILEGVARRAYERGYKHGKAVASREVVERTR